MYECFYREAVEAEWNSIIHVKKELLFYDMYRSANDDEPVCPEEWKPERHDPEETISLECLDSCRDKKSLREKHTEKP